MGEKDIDIAAYVGRVFREHAEMREALLECEEYFDGKQDVEDGPQGDVYPNREMRLCQMVQIALGKDVYGGP